MKLKNKITVILIIFAMILVAAGCETQEEEEENGGEGNGIDEETLENLNETEDSVMEIMKYADLVPVLEGKVSPKKGEGEEEEEEEEDEEDEKDEGNENNGEEEENYENNSFKENVTFEETILGETIKREMEAKEDEEDNDENGEDSLPGDAGEAWQEIKDTLAELRNQWDELKPVLKRENVRPGEIELFGETVDELTIATTQQDYLSVLETANQLTGYLAGFKAPFADNATSAAYELKYYTRSVNLAAAEGDFDLAVEHLKEMEKLGDGLEDDLEEKDEEEIYEEFEESLEELERAVEKNNLDLVKIAAAEVMENVVEMIEEVEPDNE